LNVALLSFLRAAGQQDHQNITVAAEIDPVAGSEIDLVFKDTFADRFDPREVALLDACDRDRDLGARRDIQSREPIGKRRAAVTLYVVTDFKHGRWVT
jgi:hypothetical protein